MVCRLIVFCKEKTAYEMRIRDWSSRRVRRTTCSSPPALASLSALRLRIGKTQGMILSSSPPTSAPAKVRTIAEKLTASWSAGCPTSAIGVPADGTRSEEHTSELQFTNAHIVCRLLLEQKKTTKLHR